MRFGIVILHYNVVEETKKCIASILEKIDVDDYEIVVVDNCSPNRSGIVIQKLYEGVNHITVILNEKNLGFAQGNNVGYRFLKYEKKCDFIALANNDTYFIQNNFCKLVKDEYQFSKFAVLGPQVHTPNGDDSNPVKRSLMTVSELEKKRARWRRFIIKNILYLGFIDTLYSMIADRLGKGPVQRLMRSDTRQENVELHGCFLIFSPKFIARYDGLNPETFLYQEEDILFAQMMKDNMLMVYNPALKIYHSEDAATNSIFQCSRKKKIFIYENYLKSSNVLLRILKEMEGQI